MSDAVTFAASQRAASCAAGITLFRPDGTVLRKLLAALRADGVPTLVHIDGPSGEAIDAGVLADLHSDPNLTILQADANRGIGAALNRLVEAAAAAGFRRIVLFDQDSDVPAGMCRSLEAWFEALEAQNRRVAVVGPQPIAPADEAIKPPRYRRRVDGTEAPDDGTVPVDYVITSGSLVSIEAWHAVGAFRADYFIDGIDTEWCLRAWEKGFEVRLVPTLFLPHRLGNGVVRFGPIAFPRQSEKRMLSYMRNRMHMLRLPYVPRRRKLQTIAYLPLQALVFVMREPTAPGAAGRFLQAARDGWRGRLGPIVRF